MKKTLRDAINDAVVEYLEHKIQTDESVNVVAMANEIVPADLLCRNSPEAEGSVPAVSRLN
jgi:hypothetical protein